MKFEETKIFNLEGALRGMRNPLDSWRLSDSKTCLELNLECNNCPSYVSYDQPCKGSNQYILGQSDLKLAGKLIKAGDEHAKFLRQIFVSVDITAPRYFWSEFDTYKIGTTSNSCSTMHTLSKKKIDVDMFEIDDIDNLSSDDIMVWADLIYYLEKLRTKYNETKDYKYFRKMKQALPESFLQKRTVTLNYEVIKNILHQRKNHRLKEWNTDFVDWVKGLPYSKELILMED